MPSRLYCWLNGHDWGPWRRGYENIFGVPMKARWCRQCGAQDQAGDHPDEAALEARIRNLTAELERESRA